MMGLGDAKGRVSCSVSSPSVLFFVAVVMVTLAPRLPVVIVLQAFTGEVA